MRIRFLCFLASWTIPASWHFSPSKYRLVVFLLPDSNEYPVLCLLASWTFSSNKYGLVVYLLLESSNNSTQVFKWVFGPCVSWLPAHSLQTNIGLWYTWFMNHRTTRHRLSMIPVWLAFLDYLGVFGIKLHPHWIHCTDCLCFIPPPSSPSPTYLHPFPKFPKKI